MAQKHFETERADPESEPYVLGIQRINRWSQRWESNP
jgi:hypothetical protein